MWNSPWIRTPDFKKVPPLNYEDYWKFRGWEINTSLKVREKIILEMIPKGSKVLDIGCGNSLLPLKLKQKGIDVEVADISQVVLKSYEKLGILGKKIDLENMQSGDITAKYDYIILSEVLEHLRFPEEAMRHLKKSTCRFILTVPNSASYQFRYGLLFRGRFFTQWVMHPSEHLRFWSHIDFLDWLSALGLFVERVEVSEGLDLRGRLPWLPKLWKNLLGYRMVYLVITTD